MNDFAAAVKKLNSNSSLKQVKAKKKNEQKMLMINSECLQAFKVHGKGTFSNYINELMLHDMKSKGWL